MPQEIYNEGRVVGLSAWEIFMKECLSEGMDPSDIPNEAQWLTSMIGMGASMILKIPSGTTAGIHDYPLPTGSNLTASGVIIANPFLGDCAFDLTNWAMKVTSYSPLISNTSSSSPSTGTEQVPSGTYAIADYGDLVSNFAKIVDGIVYTKNAEWEDTISGTPKKDIDPNFNNSSTVIRLYINTTLTSDVKILFTGFNNKRLLQAVSAHSEGGVGGCTDTEHNNWINGGMLGPEIIPWATKIVFSVPTSTYNLANSLTRTIPSDTTYTAKTIGGITFKNVTDTVKTNSLIDLNSINLGDYYSVHSSEFSSSPTLQENVTEVALGLNDSYSEVVAWYPGMTAAKINAATDSSKIFPPALYATQITSTGTKTLVPLDTAAPGTVKGFKNSTQAYNYTQQMPDNYSIYYNSTNQSFTFVTPNQSDSTKWSGTAKIDYLTEPKAQVTAGNASVKVIALSKSNGTDYSTSGTASTTTATAANRGKLNWDILLNSLKSNATYDFVGDNVRNFAIDLDNSRIGTSKAISNISTTNLTLKGQGIILSSSTSGSDKIITSSGATYKSGKNYIEFTDGTRLYISKTQPASGMRTGDIGIGW